MNPLHNGLEGIRTSDHEFIVNKCPCFREKETTSEYAHYGCHAASIKQRGSSTGCYELDDCRYRMQTRTVGVVVMTTGAGGTVGKDSGSLSPFMLLLF